MTEPKKRVIYLPPAPEAIDDYAKKVCQTLGEHVSGDYSTPDVIWGLSSFMKFAIGLYAAYLNNQNEK